jgi:hypothetical protein
MPANKDKFMIDHHDRFPGKILRYLGILTIICMLAAFSGAQPLLKKALDYDGDGKTDPTVYRASEGNWYVQYSAGGYFGAYVGAGPSDIFVPGNYDRDRVADIAIWRPSTGDFYILESQTNTFVTIQHGQANDEPVARDYDGDGKTDCAVARRVNGALIWIIRRSSDTSVFSVNWGLSYDYVAPGDYDGDGRYDQGVYRPTPNNGQATFYIMRSTLGYTAAAFGLSNDLVVPGDYDGDGKTDFTVVRDNGANLVWYGLKSSNGAFWGDTFGLGNGADYPVQGDYDGDGKTDVSVWRTASGEFFVHNSSNGGLGYSVWGMNGDYPLAYYDVH